MSSCRTCHAPKWKGDPCPMCGAGLKTLNRGKTPPITLNVKHGFHEPCTTRKAN